MIATPSFALIQMLLGIHLQRQRPYFSTASQVLHKALTSMSMTVLVSFSASAVFIDMW